MIYFIQAEGVGHIKIGWMAGDGFTEVVARHGSDAIEYELLSRCKGRADAARREGQRQE